MQTGIIALLGLASLFVGWILTLVLPGIRYISWGMLLLGAILVLVAFVIDYRRVRGALASRRGRFSTGTTLMVSIFVGIILLVNAISYANFHRFDVTGLSQYTLTSQTKSALEGMETPVEALLFTVPGDTTGGFLQNLLDEYKNFTDQLGIELIDPEQQPDQARQCGVSQYPAVVFRGEAGQRSVLPQNIISVTEQGDMIIEAEYAFTSAILEVTGSVQKKVYFLTGHGENSIFSTSADGYSTVREGLLDNLYQVESLDIRIAGDIPEDCTVLVIAGPKGSLTGREADLIEQYLENGGWALILVDPNPPKEFRELISQWGMDIRDGVIIDEGSFTAPHNDSPLVPLLRNYFAQYGMYGDTYFPGATAMLPQAGFEAMAAISQSGLAQFTWVSEDSQAVLYSLLRTSQESWLETDLQSDTEPQFDEESDILGSLNIGFFVIRYPDTVVDVEDEEAIALFTAQAFAGTRLIVVGDSDFTTNAHFQNGDNGTLFLTSIHFLTQGKELITMDRKYLQTRRLIIGPEATSFITISSIGLLPLLVLVAGAYIWWRRR
ncbi:MAG TPA: Gldg family protein [Dehalococcoidales bacterium]|nr:Gldg family protein [Dehalococcoidales bacterium]